MGSTDATNRYQIGFAKHQGEGHTQCPKCCEVIACTLKAKAKAISYRHDEELKETATFYRQSFKWRQLYGGRMHDEEVAARDAGGKRDHHGDMFGSILCECFCFSGDQTPEKQMALPTYLVIFGWTILEVLRALTKELALCGSTPENNGERREIQARALGGIKFTETKIQAKQPQVARVSIPSTWAARASSGISPLSSRNARAISFLNKFKPTKIQDGFLLERVGWHQPPALAWEKSAASEHLVCETPAARAACFTLTPLNMDWMTPRAAGILSLSLALT